MSFEEWWNEYMKDKTPNGVAKQAASEAWEAAKEDVKEEERQRQLDMPW